MAPTAARPPGRPGGTVEVDRVAEVVARLRRELRRGARAGFPAEQLSVAQLELLAHLAEHPGARAGELALALHLAPTTVSTLLGPLLAAGAVRRTADPHDRRAWALHLAPAGRTQLDRWQRVNEHVLTGALAELSAADRRAVERALPALERLTDRLAARF